MLPVLPKYLNRYPQIYPSVLRTKTIIERLPLTSSANKTPGKFELEARFGTLQDTSRQRHAFVPGVTKEFMEAALSKMEEFGGWDEVTPWTESQDFYYEIPPDPEDLDEKALLVRTTTEFKRNSDGTATCVRTHMCKHPRDQHDFKFVPAGSHVPRVAYDLRIKLSFEEPVPEDLLPAVVVEPTLVRIKTRKSFRYRSSAVGSGPPVWSFDFTQSWSGRTYEEAEQKQKMRETGYEIEVECLNPYAYLMSAGQDQFTLATSLLLKMRDFIGKTVPFRWEPLAE